MHLRVRALEMRSRLTSIFAREARAVLTTVLRAFEPLALNKCGCNKAMIAPMRDQVFPGIGSAFRGPYVCVDVCTLEIRRLEVSGL